MTYCLIGNSGGEVAKNCSEQAVFNSIIINPPFRTCQTAFSAPGAGTAGSNFDVYVIKGSIGPVSGQTMSNLISDDGSRNLAIQIVADNIINNRDEIKIADSNSPFMTIYFIIDAGDPEAEIVPFTISEISTQCTDVGFADTPQVN